MNWSALLNAQRLGQPSEEASSLQGRNEFQRDFDRLVFSGAFRRLQGKTQVFPFPESDFVHTRLTHSMEASCVGRSLGNLVGQQIESFLPEGMTPEHVAAIVATACLAHDIGNPPFGHAGENAIQHFFAAEGENYLLELDAAQRTDLQRFEGNALGFRLLTRTPPAWSKRPGGLRLTYASLGAFGKYPCGSDCDTDSGASSKKFGVFQSEAETMTQVATELQLLPKSGSRAWYRHPFAFLVEAADDICYQLVDLEDGYQLGLLPYETIARPLRTILDGDDAGLDNIYDESEQVAYLRSKVINMLVEETAQSFLANLDSILTGDFDRSLLKTVPCMEPFSLIKEMNRQVVYKHRPVLEIEAAGFEVLPGLLKVFLEAAFDSPQSLKSQKILELVPQSYRQANGELESAPYELVMSLVEYVAAMTDRHALETFRILKGISLPKNR